VFSIDALVCPSCLGPMSVIAYITVAAVVSKILTHLGLPNGSPALSPARGPAQLALFEAPSGPARPTRHPPALSRSRGPPTATGAELVVELDELLPEPEGDWGA
jgi:hypothetical protein